MNSDNETPAAQRQGPQRLADLLRRGMAQARQHSAPGLGQLEAGWKQRELELQRLEAAERARHQAAQVDAWPLHLKLCGAPAEAVVALSGDKVLETPALRAARQLLQQGLRTLLLSGGTGVGKTTGACHLFHAAVRTETRTGQRLQEWDASAGLFLRWSQLKRVSDYETEDRFLLQRAHRARVLVLDDLGGLPGEVVGPRHRELLEELVDRRDRPGMVTAYTTNLSVRRDAERAGSDFSEHVGARVVSRMCRQGTFLLHDCGTRDLRRGGTP
ncbi:hypothetical protein [Myxococcus sp. AS-1-15]|uniref:hypothetical protein n=1 Tax=Myxococcus sp. AS-1-15 TaxID=2874600 RepID=UPI001CBF9A44|nr:hypothetical protein [Myxococcus sp. AS-1-15]MBZ4395148.1 hypothetical protein [Myxococcus sp. AS-1-15]